MQTLTATYSPEDNKLRLTGFEEVDGAAYAQTWVVETA